MYGFQLTDAEAERSGVDVLAKHALWSWMSTTPWRYDWPPSGPLVVFRVCHQLHGAVGFCDRDHTVWLSRQPAASRLPLSCRARPADPADRPAQADGAFLGEPGLEDFPPPVRQWCRAYVPADWRTTDQRRRRRVRRNFQKVWEAACMNLESGRLNRSLFGSPAAHRAQLAQRYENWER